MATNPIRNLGHALEATRPFKVPRFDSGALPDPGQCTDCLIIINDRYDGLPRGRLAISNGASWDSVAWLDDIKLSRPHQITADITSLVRAAVAEITVPVNRNAPPIVNMQRAISAQPASLKDIKTSLVDGVQRQFESRFSSIMTPGAAMATVYRIEADAAYRLLCGTITTHPVIAMLVGVGDHGATELDVAKTIAARNEQCEALIAALNRKRLIAKSAIMAAANESAARAAAAVNWDA